MMFRRLRRGFGIPLGRRLNQLGDFFEVKRAEDLLAKGNAPQAADLLARLAGEREAMGHLRQAANLHTRAAHAWIDAGMAQRAVQQARLALGLFTSLARPRRAAEFRAAFAAHLRQKFAGQPEENFAGDFDLAAAPDAASRRGQLPAECPQCGAPARSDAVEWINDHSAECDFCGAVLTAKM